jgi:hypothetical protein
MRDERQACETMQIGLLGEEFSGVITGQICRHSVITRLVLYSEADGGRLTEKTCNGNAKERSFGVRAREGRPAVHATLKTESPHKGGLRIPRGTARLASAACAHTVKRI